MKRARAAAPAPSPAPPKSPPPRLWNLPGHGKLRATAHPPRTFPHPLEILGARPPPPGFPQLRTAATTRATEGTEKVTESQTVGGQGGHLHQP